jgi:hypothetical protein
VADLQRFAETSAPHPRQPRGLRPNLSAELALDRFPPAANTHVALPTVSGNTGLN